MRLRRAGTIWPEASISRSRAAGVRHGPHHPPLCVVVWLVFSKLKLVRWGWLSGIVTVAIGVAIVGVFMALFNHLTPSGRIAVAGRVVDVTPNVGGQVIAIPVETNVLVKAGTILFQIDPAPYRFKVRQLAAALAEARQNVKRMQADYEQATAEVAGLTAQLRYQEQRLADTQRLTRTGATAEFREEDTRVQAELLTAQLQAARARQRSASLALELEIEGENTSVAQLEAQLDNAEWELGQTTIPAPADGYVTLAALAVGDRVAPTRGVMSFVVADDVAIIGVFQQNGLQTIKPGTSARLVFSNQPGKVYDTKVLDIARGIGQGQLAVSGTLAQVGSIGITTEYPVRLEIPQDIDRDLVRPGMSGTATVLAPNAGVIGVIASVLLWVNAYLAYL